MINLVLAFLGFVLYILIGMIKTKRKHIDKKFSVQIYLKDEILTISAAAICAVSVWLMLPDIGAVLTPEYVGHGKVLSFLGGFLNYSIISMLVNAVLPKKFEDQTLKID